MGFLNILKNLNNAEGIRESMRMSYDKHLKKARAGSIGAPGTPPAHCALYGALGTRYQASGMLPPEPLIWAELTPFLCLSDSDAREQLAEYVVYREKPNEARVAVLRTKLNEGIRRANVEVRLMAFFAVQQGVAWTELLDKESREMLKTSISTE